MTISARASGATQGIRTADIVDRCTLGFADLPEDVVATAKHSILDYLGVALAGSREPVVDMVASVTDTVGNDTARPTGTILGRRERAGLVDAALINGTAGHALDFDDTHLAMEGHPSSPVLAALLALCEARETSGVAFLTAFVAGVEAECLLGTALNPDHYGAGWHASATLGRFGATAACSRLAELSPESTCHALGLAAVQAAGLKCVFGNMAKPFQVGKAAADGLLSVLLAERGVTSHPSIVEAPGGFAALYNGDLVGQREPLPASDHFFTRSIVFKFHAACHLLHPLIDSLSSLIVEQQLAPTQIHRVDIYLSDAVHTGCGIEKPATGLEAKFSARAAAALVMLGHDTGNPQTFSDSRISERSFHDALGRVHVAALERSSGWLTRVRLTTDDGRTFGAEADLDAHAPQLDHQWQRLSEKFFALASPVVGKSQAAQLHALVRDFETLPRAAAVMTLCGGKTSTWT